MFVPRWLGRPGYRQAREPHRRPGPQRDWPRGGSPSPAADLQTGSGIDAATTIDGLAAAVDRWGPEIEVVRQLQGNRSSYELSMQRTALTGVLRGCIEFHDDPGLSDSERVEFATDRAAVESILTSLDSERVAEPA